MKNRAFWLQLVNLATPFVALFVPGAAPLIPYITAGTQEAEQLAGASGADKLQHALNIVSVGIGATNTAAGRTVIDPTAGTQAAASVINTVVSVANIVHAAHAPAAAASA